MLAETSSPIFFSPYYPPIVPGVNAQPMAGVPVSPTHIFDYPGPMPSLFLPPPLMPVGVVSPMSMSGFTAFERVDPYAPRPER